MKQVTTSTAHKKVRKNIRKVFHSAEADELHALLSRSEFKNVISLYDKVSLRPELSETEADLNVLTQEVLEEVYGNTFAQGPYTDEAIELSRILSSLYLRSFVEAYHEVATRHYHMPELPETGFFVTGAAGMYSTAGSLMLSHSSQIAPITALGQTDLRSNAYAFGSGAVSAHEVRVNGATLTGGGVGTAFPPVEGTVKMIGIEKGDDSDLGFTVVEQEYTSSQYGEVKELVVKRIMAGSRVEQQGLLHEGDVIREVNGVPVDRPETLQKLLREASGAINMKIIPGTCTSPVASQLFLRAHFSYNPQHDNLIPCKEAGITFQAGDILQVLKQEDPYWWQARQYQKQARAGLIPSVVLEERRRAFTQSAPNPEELTYKMFACGLARKRRKKVTVAFRAREANTYESKDLVLYEEVALISGFQRPVICLLGAPGVGRRILKRMLISTYPQLYGTALPHTSRERLPEEVDGEAYLFETRESMEMGNMQQQFLEFGELEGHYYGTKFDTIRQVVQSSRTCLIDCSPQAVRLLRTSEFMPYVVFVAAPSVSCMKAMYEYGVSMGFSDKWKHDEDFRRAMDTSRNLERNYRHLIDFIILCDNIEATFEALSEKLNSVLTQPQWVPARWLY